MAKSGVVTGVPSGLGPVMSGFKPLELGRRYVVVAHRLTDDERSLFQLDREGERFGVASMCGAVLFDEAEKIGYLEGVGPRSSAS
jgi:hypothetical protein